MSGPISGRRAPTIQHLPIAGPGGGVSRPASPRRLYRRSSVRQRFVVGHFLLRLSGHQQRQASRAVVVTHRSVSSHRSVSCRSRSACVPRLAIVIVAGRVTVWRCQDRPLARHRYHASRRRPPTSTAIALALLAQRRIDSVDPAPPCRLRRTQLTSGRRPPSRPRAACTGDGGATEPPIDRCRAPRSIAVPTPTAMTLTSPPIDAAGRSTGRQRLAVEQHETIARRRAPPPIRSPAAHATIAQPPPRRRDPLRPSELDQFLPDDREVRAAIERGVIGVDQRHLHVRERDLDRVARSTSVARPEPAASRPSPASPARPPARPASSARRRPAAAVASRAAIPHRSPAAATLSRGADSIASSIGGISNARTRRAGGNRARQHPPRRRRRRDRRARDPHRSSVSTIASSDQSATRHSPLSPAIVTRSPGATPSTASRATACAVRAPASAARAAPPRQRLGRAGIERGGQFDRQFAHTRAPALARCSPA